MKCAVFICLILLAFVQGGAAQTVPYTLGEGGYKVVELEGFVPDAGSKLWDLSRLATTGYETDLRFDAVSDTVFTATTNDTRQTFHFTNGGWSLTRSETPTSVGCLSPGGACKRLLVQSSDDARQGLPARSLLRRRHRHPRGVGARTPDPP